MKTTDGGETWTNVTDGQLKTSSVGAIAIAPSDANVLYVGMGEHAIRGVMTSHGDGVYKSTDAGKTWTHIGLPRSRAISRIHVHPTNPDLVYVAAQGAPYGPSEDRGVYRSKDGGASLDEGALCLTRRGPFRSRDGSEKSAHSLRRVLGSPADPMGGAERRSGKRNPQVDGRG